MRSTIKKSLYIGLLMATFAYSCRKESATTPALPDTQLALNINHHCDGILIVFDTILYTNESGSKYSVTRLEYYISGIRLYDNGIVKYQSNQINYVNGREPINKITLNNLPIGNYTDIDFLIGLATTQNISNSLDNTAENVNMQWPEVIGGGYHFLKFEGRYIDTANVNVGFTMHIGTNDMLVQHKKLAQVLTIQEKTPVNLGLFMNINEWFKNPYTYNFNKDGNYTMAIPELMTLLKNNGYDTFTIKE